MEVLNKTQHSTASKHDLDYPWYESYNCKTLSRSIPVNKPNPELYQQANYYTQGHGFKTGRRNHWKKAIGKSLTPIYDITSRKKKQQKNSKAFPCSHRSRFCFTQPNQISSQKYSRPSQCIFQIDKYGIVKINLVYNISAWSLTSTISSNDGEMKVKKIHTCRPQALGSFLSQAWPRSACPIPSPHR